MTLKERQDHKIIIKKFLTLGRECLRNAFNFNTHFFSLNFGAVFLWYPEGYSLAIYLSHVLHLLLFGNKRF
jgi:hypothetical protein